MPRITELYAWVVCDTGPDDEGVPAFMGPGGWMPLMGADLARAESLRVEAIKIARMTGKPVRLLRSVALEQIDAVVPADGD